MLTFVLGIAMTPNGPLEMVKMFGDGFWNLLAFSMQMALVLVTGHALASSPLLRRHAENRKLRENTCPRCHACHLHVVCCLYHQLGLWLGCGALFAREVARRVPKSDYRLLIASAYIGFLPGMVAYLVRYR